MAKLPSKFNTKDHGDMGFEPLPKGDYLMEITESDYKENSQKTGHYVMLKRVVLEGKYKGRVLYANMNIDHPNSSTREIGSKEFSASCKACGFITVEETSELHGIPHMVSLAVVPGQKDAPDRNKIMDIKKCAGLSTPLSSSIKFDDDVVEEVGEKEKPKMKAIFEDDEEIDTSDSDSSESHPAFEDD